MLVHMTPGEVHGLQALAMKHGGTLTVNPDTGLPEANFLKSLLPMLAGFALGPAGMGIAFGGLSSAASAGLLVGGVTGLATGSLQKGLMAGLGAYGGAGLGAGMSELGAAELAQQHISDKMPAYMGDPAAYAAEVNAVRDNYLNAANTKAFSPMEKLTAGFSSATASPTAMGQFAKANMMPLGMAAAPIMADMMVPTTTKSAPIQSPGRIVEKRWNGREFVPVASTDAGVFNTSGRTFSDPYRGYNGGGIVALAEGGVPGYAGNAGSVVSAPLDTKNEIYQFFAKPETQALLASGTGDSTIAGVLQDKNWSLADVAKATGTQSQLGDFETRFVNAVAQPGVTADQFNAYTADVGLAGQNLATALQDSGLSQAAQYALTHDLNDINTDYGNIGTDVYKNLGYTPGVAPGDVGGLKGLYDNINFATKAIQGQINEGKLSVEGAQKLADDEMKRIGVSKADVKAATGKDFVNLFMPKTVTKIDTIVGATGNDTITGGTGNNATQNTTTNVAIPTSIATADNTALPVGVSGAGVTTINPNGTVTTRPDLSLGMSTVRNNYVAGGGDLGYTSPVPTSLGAFNKTYVTDRMSDDSLAAYEYLTGKKGAKYPTKSGFAGQLSQDYATAVLGYPARGNLPYIYNKATGKMDPNPDYVAPGRDAAGNVTYTMSLNDIKKSLTDTPLSGQALYDWAISNNLSAQQIADATERSLSSVYSDFRAGSKAKTEADKKKTDDDAAAASANTQQESTGLASGGMPSYALGGLGTLGGYSDGGRLLKGPGDGVSDSIPATIGRKQQPARLADGEFVIPARIVSELGNGSTDAGAKKLYAMMDRVQRARGKTTGKNKVAANSRADKYLPA
jgi:hypothetical protein